MNIRQITAGALVAGCLGAAGLGLGAGTANADGAHHWCPGNPKTYPYVVNEWMDWDWNVCHTWWPVNYG